ncbi:(2Fe-2S) ferredoxin domain-containing protein [Bacillus sp. PS06]|uniref:(2Fe-2S) ferredoxin domain-containing protein n=1 Tax=Bacillus sp. PS06 TaxID=2764176 RepID=UPI001786DB35|nr:(2Fe-2S) ferredoxin domain-containing protein [Bacillus sp. PS06]MBD8068778.1 (2Fe-2S) ferredoxin domain-containing protein [Bacillus sp. PS06]
MATWDLGKTEHHVLICNGSSCNKVGAEELTQALRKEISARGVDETIHTTRTRCNGRCLDKCVVIDYPKGTWYKDLTPDDAAPFIDSLLNDIDYTVKVSHTFCGQGFERANGVATGISKDKEKVIKVSKIM